jgi:hypothetical protein
MITIKDIIGYSKEHPIKSGRQTRLANEQITISIVGGASGLYGDFEKDFEVAVIDKLSGDFVTKIFYPEASDDIIGYMTSEQVESFVNQILHKDFQVL